MPIDQPILRRGSSLSSVQRRNKQGVAKTFAPGSWLPWGLALAVIARKTVFQRSRTGELAYTQVDAHAMAEIVIVCIALVVVCASPQLTPLLRKIRHSSGLLLLSFYCLGVVSSLWSDQPAYSGYKATEALSQILLIFLAISYCKNFRQAETCVLTVCLVDVLMGLALVVKYHGFSLTLHDWHTNQYTASAMMLTCYCVAELLRATGRRRKHLIYFATFGFCAVALGTSSASIISLMFGFGVAAQLLRGARWPLVALLAFVTLCAIISPQTVMAILFPNKTEEQITSLRGRETMWTEMAEYAAESPLIGYGFAMGPKLGRYQATNSHNSFFAVLLGTGLVGVGIAAFVVLRFVREARDRVRGLQPGSVGCICAIAGGFLNSMSMAFIGESWQLPSFVFACFFGLHLLFVKTAPRRSRSRRVRTLLLTNSQGGV